MAESNSTLHAGFVEMFLRAKFSYSKMCRTTCNMFFSIKIEKNTVEEKFNFVSFWGPRERLPSFRKILSSPQRKPKPSRFKTWLSSFFLVLRAILPFMDLDPDQQHCVVWVSKIVTVRLVLGCEMFHFAQPDCESHTTSGRILCAKLQYKNRKPQITRCSGILVQSMGARNRAGIGYSVTTRFKALIEIVLKFQHCGLPAPWYWITLFGNNSHYLVCI